MAPEFKLILFLILTPVLIFLLQIIISRILGSVNISPQLIVLVCLFFGSLFMAIIIYNFIMAQLTQTFQRQITMVIYSFVVYFSLAYAYFHLFNMSETARRIRILYEIYLKGRIGLEELYATYSPKQILDARLERLLETRQIKYQNGRYLLKSHLLYYAAWVVALWSKILGFARFKNFR